MTETDRQQQERTQAEKLLDECTAHSERPALKAEILKLSLSYARQRKLLEG